MNNKKFTAIEILSILVIILILIIILGTIFGGIRLKWKK